jgi:hypothetical protein
MTKQEFIDNYVCTFMASHTASRYDELCLRDKHKELEEGQPIEDAIYLAKRAYDLYLEHIKEIDKYYGTGII